MLCVDQRVHHRRSQASHPLCQTSRWIWNASSSGGGLHSIFNGDLFDYLHERIWSYLFPNGFTLIYVGQWSIDGVAIKIDVSNKRQILR